MNLISVIVPIYKVEAYLDKCVQSIVDQTYTNLEIILVDDGSPDRCGEMCDEWAKKDTRIRVIHKENGGQADARNVGMAISTGEYIAFVDSDDWIEPQMYQSMYEAAVATDSDVVSCGVTRIWFDGKSVKDSYCYVSEDSLLEQEMAMEVMIRGNGLVQIPCNKLYRRSLTQGIMFPVGISHEDDFWTWQVIAKATRVVILKEHYYNYLQRSDSTMGERYSEKRLVVVRAKIERQVHVEKFFPKLRDIGRMDLVYTCMHQGIQVLKAMRWKDAVKHMKYLKGTIRDYPVSEEYLRTLSLKKRLHLKMLRACFVPVCLFHSIRE